MVSICVKEAIPMSQVRAEVPRKCKKGFLSTVEFKEEKRGCLFSRCYMLHATCYT